MPFVNIAASRLKLIVFYNLSFILSFIHNFTLFLSYLLLWNCSELKSHLFILMLSNKIWNDTLCWTILFTIHDFQSKSVFPGHGLPPSPLWPIEVSTRTCLPDSWNINDLDVLCFKLHDSRVETEFVPEFSRSCLKGMKIQIKTLQHRYACLHIPVHCRLSKFCLFVLRFYGPVNS